MPNGNNAVSTKRVAYGVASRIADYTKSGAATEWRTNKTAQPITKRNNRTSRASAAQARNSATYIGKLANKGFSPAPYGAPGGRKNWKGYEAPSENRVRKAVKNVGMQTSKRYRPKTKKSRKKAG